MKVKDESAKAGLLLNIKKTNIMLTDTEKKIQIDGKENEVVQTLSFLRIENSHRS